MRMGAKSKISWTDASWNPVTGCSHISAGCDNCYAEKMAERLQKIGSLRYKNGFKVTMHEDVLSLPLKWKQPKKIFVNSMSDLFHSKVENLFIKRVFETMSLANWHIFQVLTKRPERMMYIVNNALNPVPKNVWLGVSVESPETKHRIDNLRLTKCSNRFISFEPLLRDVGELNLKGIKWAIIGGESGANHRPIQKEWILNIQKQCEDQGVTFFFKQWGGRTPKANGNVLDGKVYENFPKEMKVQKDG